MDPSPEQLDALQARFSTWAQHWYRFWHGEDVKTSPYTTKSDQARFGDVRVDIPNLGPVNYDEKVYSKLWDGLLVELLQASEPDANGQPTSLGWFYHLGRCHYLLCGYYREIGDERPAVVYRVDLPRLRSLYRRLLVVSKRRPAVISIKGYGVTVAVVLAWDLLLKSRCIEQVYIESDDVATDQVIACATN